MNRVTRGLVSLGVAAGLAAGSAVLATQVLHDRRADAVAAQGEPLKAEARTDRVVNALAGLADDGVYVAPDARDMLDRAGEKRVARAVAAAQTPVKVVVWTDTRHAGASGFDTVQQLEAGLAESGERGVYLIWQGPENGDINTFGPYGYLTMSPHDEFAGDPSVTLPRLVKRVDGEVRWPERDTESDYWGGVSGGIMAGALIGVGVLLGIGTLYGLFVGTTKRRLPGTWRW
ncbi:MULTISPECIES: hypothetical protein [unclassified Nocardioides]|uniref:hypothetical protein n=1 Tax=unclassified Nocardioides TaxID=2615069 RepID=UPI0006F392B9|nr:MULTISPECIES: hypothetical protein [unclassified Nocardioides]KQY56515.1 hypothetical protein ASD30_09265 [Nocardioides sp. Root140]KQZ75271.1 hypothetical protein ASD66_02575 [Nocardioides sp. Root151]KRF14351.1 hypothetical protein ASH02_08370 [Nocardioides sp. Soil796]